MTSGGDSPGMNAAIRAIVRCGIDAGLEVYGIERGYDGLIAGKIFEMNRRSVSDIVQHGGTILRTARSKAFQTEEGFGMAQNMLSSFHIDVLIVIGGNGSLAGALDLAKEGTKVIGLPGTIDNDLAYTDFTIGFDTSINTVLYAVSNVRDTSHSHDRTTIIEVMGAKSGDIAVYAGLAGGSELILVPEQPVDIAGICRTLIENRNRGKMSSIIIKAEGVDIPTDELDREITERTGLDVKTVILGYIQRGGSPSAADRILASRLGSKAVQLVLNGEYNKVVGIKDNKIIAQDIGDALAQKSVPADELHDLADLLAR
jgi:6-phosphofructokinase 1